MLICFILGIALLLAAVSMLVKKVNTLGVINCAGYSAILLLVSRLIFFQELPKTFFNFFYLDGLSAFFVFTVSIISFAAALFSIGYIAKEVKDGHVSEKKAKAYYVFFNLFCFSMFLVTLVNNLGMMWVAIEMTTLTSAFLVGFHNNKTSVEAAWKYIIICSVGIIFALLGIIIFYYNAALFVGVKSINWTDMAAVAGVLDKNMIKVAFIFIIVGYGTKAGFAPMHTWLPDAHSQAISPISALLSGVLLKTALYAILRFAIITNKCVGAGYSGKLFIIFGVLSLAVSAAFIIVQKHLKRLLAYSSIEHIGVILIGLGFGGVIGCYAALFHVFNHAVTKSLMFFSAANVLEKYKKDTLNSICAVMSVMPFTGLMMIIGTFALVGLPPFSIFFSEIMILIAGFLNASYFICALFLLFIAVIFGSMVYHMSRILFGKKPDNMPVESEPISVKLALVFLLAFICIVGVAMPPFLNKLISSAASLIAGV